MSRVAIVAYGAVSALGRGAAAASAGEIGAAAREAIERDAELAGAGLARPFAGRVRGVAGADRAGELLEQALGDCAADLDQVRPGWREARVGLVLGTSSGGMRAAERLFAGLGRGEAVAAEEGATYYGPMARASRSLAKTLDPAVLVLAACASSAVAVGLAARWLEHGACDLVLAGGFDDVTVFVASGFEALRATTAQPPPRPFRADRDGMALGEGAAVLALERASGPALAFVSGFGAACDAVHLTAPDRDGRGLARAARAALVEAGEPEVDLVSAHATATPFNDAAEFQSLLQVLGARRARAVVVHPFKAQVGHTLGAAGAIEALVCVDAMRRGVLPAAAGVGPRDPLADVRLLPRAAPGRVTSALKLSAAFGGANAALVLGLAATGAERPRRRAFVGSAAGVDQETPLDELAAETHLTLDHLARADGLVRLALSAVARLERLTGPLVGGGIVLGSALATVETNAIFAARVRDVGARSAEPRRFPFTSPNAAAGQCAIAFGLTGPSLSVGGGWHAGLEALAVAARLVEGGDAERVVVVAADEGGAVTRLLAGEAVRRGAVAALVTSDARQARAAIENVSVRRGPEVEARGPAGHLALRPLVVGGELPRVLESGSPPDAQARIDLRAL